MFNTIIGKIGLGAMVAGMGLGEIYDKTPSEGLGITSVCLFLGGGLLALIGIFIDKTNKK